MPEDIPSSDVNRQERLRNVIGAARMQAARVAQRGGESTSVDLGGRRGAAGSRGRGFTDAVADWLPGYEVLREIHRGGQGVVYEAVQRSTGQHVALKVMKEGPFADASERARFEREVRILATLNHPNIVAIHDSGRAAGHDYVVMDYIAGRPLDEHVRAMASGQWRPADQALGGRLAGLATAPMSADAMLREKLRLFVIICEAVNAAHVRGIIHRDLKPGNIRVDEGGRPHVLDFGLAKVSEGDLAETVTQSGQFVGSLPWASPESAAGRQDQIDIRSDVYSLGVMLYQLLADRYPYPVVGPVRDVMNTIATVEPERPSRHAPGLDDDLDTIVLKCLAKEPARRYQSAADLARDVTRYLSGEPIEAKRDSRLYVLGKALRRHRMAAAAGSTLTVVVIVAAVISFSQWRIAAAARDRAEAEAANAQAVNEFMRSIFEKASPYVNTERDVTVRQALDAAAEEVVTFAKDRPEVEANIRMSLAESYFGAGRPTESEKQARSCLEIRERLFGRDSGPAGEAINMLSLCRYMQNDFPGAEALAREGLAIFRRLHPGDDLDTAYSLECLAKPIRFLGKSDEAEAVSREAVGMYERLTGRGSAKTARALSNLASALSHNPAKADEQRKLVEESIEIHTRLFGRNHYMVARGLRELGDMRFIARDPEAAEKAYREALAIQKQCLGVDHPDTLACMDNLAALLRNSGRLQEAIALQREVIDGAKAVYGEDSMRYADSLASLGETVLKAGDEAGARAAFEEMIAIWDRNDFPARLPVRSARTILADIDLRAGQSEQAEALLRKTLTEKDDSPPATRWVQSHAMSMLGGILAGRGDVNEAERLLSEGAEGILTFKLANLAYRQAAVDRLVRFYEQRAAAEPNAGYAEKAEAWRAKRPTSMPAGGK